MPTYVDSSVIISALKDETSTLDAVHLAVANNFNPDDMAFLTFDKKQASVARQMGFSVVGA